MLRYAGIALGIGCGLAIGAIIGPIGIVLGVLFGGIGGIVVGHVIESEELRRTHRTRELDAIIGTTTGDMGAGPVSLYSTEARRAREASQRWADEWLTPPPPKMV